MTGVQTCALPILRSDIPARYEALPGDIVGVTLTGGWIARWFGLSFDASYGGGTFQQKELYGNFALPTSADTTWSRVLLRLGPRLPFHSVAFTLGPGAGLQEVDLTKVRTGVVQALLGGFAGFDIQPLCDFGLTLMADAYVGTESPNDIAGSLQAGVFFEPNAQCTRERATRFGLRTQP